MLTSPGQLFGVELEAILTREYEIIHREASPKKPMQRMRTRVQQDVRKFMGDGAPQHAGHHDARKRGR
jgi:hypothetical protein